MPGIDAKSDAIYELVEEARPSSASRPDSPSRRARSGTPASSTSYFSDMPGRRSAQVHARRDGHRGAPCTVLQVQRHDATRRTRPARLRARHELARARAGGRCRARRSRFHYEGTYLNSPNDVIVSLRREIYFSDPWYGRFPGFGVERPRELGWQGVFIPPGGGRRAELAVGRRRSRCRTGSASRPTSRSST